MTYPWAERRTTHPSIFFFIFFRLTRVLSPLGKLHKAPPVYGYIKSTSLFIYVRFQKSWLHSSPYSTLKMIPLYFFNETQDDRLSHHTAAPSAVSKIEQRFPPIESGSQEERQCDWTPTLSNWTFAHRFECLAKGLFLWHETANDCLTAWFGIRATPHPCICRLLPKENLTSPFLNRSLICQVSPERHLKDFPSC